MRCGSHLRVFLRIGCAALCGCVLAVGHRAHAADVPATAATPAAPAAPADVVEGHSLRIKETGVVVDVGCEGRATLRLGSKVYVACGPDGVVEIDVSNPQAPRRAGQMSVGGEATALFERDGRVWVEIAHVEARPVSTGAAAAQSPAPVAPPPVVEAPAAGPPGPSLLTPPRRAGLWELSASVGAFANIGPLGGGGVGSASAVYRFEAPIVVRAELAPAGFCVAHSSTTTNGGNLPYTSTDNGGRFKAVGAGQLLVGVDTQFVEVALGGGVSTVRSPNQYTYVNGFYVAESLATSGPAIVAEARFGARDGLALSVESNAVAANDKFQLGFFVGTVQVPLTRSAMLLFRGGGGDTGVLYGDMGTRVIVQGDGGPDTIALSGFFGGAGINFETCTANQTSPPSTTCETFSLGGPSIAGAIEYRR